MPDRVRSYDSLIGRFRAASDALGGNMRSVGEFTCPMGSYDIHRIDLVLGSGLQRICISTGMHGDEPAGPEALLLGMERIGELAGSLDAHFIFFPCDNPTGYELNTRENWRGIDLNREFQKVGQADEIAIVEESLRDEKLDLTLDLHEDIDTFGLYLYERARHGRRSIAYDMIERVRDAGYDIDEDEWIEGMPASGGVIWPSGRMRESELPKAVYLWERGCPHLITTETPGKLDIKTRMDMQMVCFEMVLEVVSQRGFAAHDGAGLQQQEANK